ncbi:MAG: hypothetical protein Q9171_002344 [Xanthocarpia ochracea]
MAGPSKYPAYLDFDEEETEYGVDHSASEEDDSSLDEPPRYPCTLFDDLMREDSDAQISDWIRSIPAANRLTANQTSPARRRLGRPAGLLDDAQSIPSDRESFARQGSGRRSGNARHSMNLADPLTEMQALSARIDKLQSLIRPGARGNVEAPLDATRSRQRTVFYCYRPFSDTRLVEWRPIPSAANTNQSSMLIASKKASNKPECLPPGRFHRRHTLCPLPTAAPSTVMRQSTVGQKRRRGMLDPHISQISEQALLDDWNEFASSARAREDAFRSSGLKPGVLALSIYPIYPFMPGANVVFLSQLLPKIFSPSKRLQVLSAIKAKAPYVPLCVVELDPSAMRNKPIKQNGEDILNANSRQEPAFQHPLGPNSAGWPTSASFDGDHPKSLPVEIFEHIGSLLPRDSIQSMRLVNREFERKISCFHFKSVVVPFKPKIYETASTQMSAKAMGKQKEANPNPENPGMMRGPTRESYNSRENHVKDGMRVFEEWGPEIKRFALTFEVAEEDLTKLKPKRRFELTNTFWGSYRWPHKHYNRYEQAAKLEQKADETSAMTTAFSKLTGIREFGLSVLSGLGWLAGKDISDRARLLKKKPTVFGSQHVLPDRGLRENIQKWDATTRIETTAWKCIRNKTARSFFEAAKEVSPVNNLPRINFRGVSPNHSDVFPPLMFDNENLEAKELSRADHIREDEATEPAQYIVTGASTPSFEPSGVIPQSLTSEQEDWLMEMEWAQDAFLSSWCIAVLDNPSVFHSLRTFNMANLSSKHLTSLQRDDIWRALPGLQNLTVLVSPDWRRVSKNAQGNVSTQPVRPSSAHALFWSFLSALFEENTSIKTLKIGYVDGGEQATGMYARNQNVIPAPIDEYPCPSSSHTGQEILYLPHIENLTLENCWLTPTALRGFFVTNRAPKLKTATFDSVSITANTDRSVLENDQDNNDLSPSTDRSPTWLTSKILPGSWLDIINTVIPGPMIAHARYTNSLLSSPSHSPSPAANRMLRSLHFNSCGYVRLPNLSGFDQSSLPELPQSPPQCLKRRQAELRRAMLDGKADGLLGTVVPCMREEEEDALKGVWGLEIGWQGELEGRGWECREDGQAEGGSGRFNGTVAREGL